jgi:hypothetical protein
VATAVVGMAEQAEIFEVGSSSRRPGPDVVDLKQMTGGAASPGCRVDV